jgi:UDP-N-acetylmuramate--alanine ligase
VLKAARQAFYGPIVAIMQPTAIRGCTICSINSVPACTAPIPQSWRPVYAAGESPIDGVSRDSLVEGLIAHGHKHVLAMNGPEDLSSLIAPLAKPGGAIVFLGAGSITQWAAGLEAALKQRNAGP